LNSKALNFCSHSRNIPILAELFESKGSKYISLVKKLDISKDTLSRTLKHLIKTGYVRKNPGYGHPLRPEYILTPQGNKLGQLSADFKSSVKDYKNHKILMSKWSIPIIFSIEDTQFKFNQLKKDVAPITSAALSRSLKELIENDFIIRIIEDKFPPIIKYSLSLRSKSFQELLKAIIEFFD